MFLSEKTAIVTGGGRGIGRGIALALAAEGCNVVVNYIRKRERAETTAAEIEKAGGSAIVVRANMAKEDEVHSLVEQAVEDFGSADIFVGNAASGVLRSVMELERNHWDWTMDVNARSILAGIQAAVPYMRQAGWGRILTITSFGSRRVLPDYSMVGVSKAAIESLTRYMAAELAPDNIICNCISPGVVMTGALDFFPRKDKILEMAKQKTPIGRLVTPEDVGQLAVWLCSDAADMIVGQTIEIDGGYSLLA